MTIRHTLLILFFIAAATRAEAREPDQVTRSFLVGKRAHAGDAS